jgi:tetratricopeptide (TPR) repeat protein
VKEQACLSSNKVSDFLRAKLKIVTSLFRGTALGVKGEAGIGKSASVRQIFANLPCGRLTVPAAAEPHRLSVLLPRPDHPLPEWIDETLFHPRKATPVPAQRFAEALHGFFARLVPFVVHVEDLHETSPWMLEVWTHFAQLACRTKGLGVIASSRQALPEPFEVVTLSGLNLEETRRLLNASLAASLPAEVVSWIQERTAGNPLFSLEYTQYLLKQQALWYDGRSWHWREPRDERLPHVVSSIIATKLEAITERESTAESTQMRRWLLELALLPDTVLEGRSLSDEERAFRTRLQVEGIWDGQVFTHPLYREALQQDLWFTERRAVARTHLETSIALAPQDAMRVVNAADLPQSEKLEAWRRLSRSAQTQSDLVTAGRALETVMPQLSPTECFQAAQWLEGVDLESSLRLLEAAHAAAPKNPLYAVHLARLQLQKLRHKSAFELLSSVSAGTDLELLRLRLLSEALFQKGDFKGVIELWRTHPELTQALSNSVSNYLIALQRLGQYEEAFAECEWFLARTTLPKLRASLINIKGLFFFAKASVHEAAQCFLEALRCLKPFVETHENAQQYDEASLLRLRIYGNLGVSYGFLGKRVEEIQIYRENLSLAQRRGTSSLLITSHNSLGQALMLAGEYEAAETQLLEARALYETTHGTNAALAVEANLCFLYLEWQPPLGATLALYHARKGLLLARQVCDPHELSRAMTSWVRAEIAHGNLETATTLATELRLYADQFQTLQLRISARWVEGLLLEQRGEISEAIAAFQEMVYLAETHPSWYHRERWALELDRLTNDETTICARLERLRGLGAEAKGLLHVSQRYFPQHFDTTVSQPVTTSGQFEVLGVMRLNGRPVPPSQKKTRRLLEVLLEARLLRRGGLDKLQLVDRLYPDVPEPEAIVALRQVVSRVRKTFGENTIIFTEGRYTLGVTSDAERFLETRDVSLWRGAFLTPTPSLSETAHGLYRALIQEMHRATPTNPSLAAGAARVLLKAYPLEEGDLRAALVVVSDADVEPLYAMQRKHWAQLGVDLPERSSVFLETV